MLKIKVKLGTKGGNHKDFILPLHSNCSKAKFYRPSRSGRLRYILSWGTAFQGRMANY